MRWLTLLVACASLACRSIPELPALAQPSVPLLEDSAKSRAAPAEVEDPIRVEVGRFALQATWLIDQIGYVRDREVHVAVTSSPRGLNVLIGRGPPSPSTLWLRFLLDDAGKTRVSAEASWITDNRIRGRDPVYTCKDLKGCVLIANEDWGPGKTLRCRFAIDGVELDRHVLLMGEFQVSNPVR